MKATYQPIKRGMTEAVTRGELEAAEREGREPAANVKQLAWFDVREGKSRVYGVFAGVVCSWFENGRYYKTCEHMKDIFALPLSSVCNSLRTDKRRMSTPQYTWEYLRYNTYGLVATDGEIVAIIYEANGTWHYKDKEYIAKKYAESAAEKDIRAHSQASTEKT